MSLADHTGGRRVGENIAARLEFAHRPTGQVVRELLHGHTAASDERQCVFDNAEGPQQELAPDGWTVERGDCGANLYRHGHYARHVGEGGRAILGIDPEVVDERCAEVDLVLRRRFEGLALALPQKKE